MRPERKEAKEKKGERKGRDGGREGHKGERGKGEREKWKGSSIIISSSFVEPWPMLFILYLHFFYLIYLHTNIYTIYFNEFLLFLVLISPFPFFFYFFPYFQSFGVYYKQISPVAVALTLGEICVFIDCVIREYIFSCRDAFGRVHFYAYATTVQKKKVFIHACASNAKRLIYIATTIQSCRNGT